MANPQASATALRLFRHLLRAASYLPDEFARVYIRSYIRSKFRQAKKPSQRTPLRLQNGRKSLNTLQWAGKGNIESLTRVLHITYGRTGRRRRELLGDLRQADAKFTPENGSTTENIVAETSGKGYEWFSQPPVLAMFLKNQAANNPPHNNRPIIREFEPKMKKTIWGQPMPLKRRPNIVKKFWAKTLDKILPPLPELEWNRLRDLSTGVIRIVSPPRRRVLVGSHGDKPEALLGSASFLRRPIRLVARSQNNTRVKEHQNHKITERFMRRIYASVWNLCPLMTYNGETEKWTIVWGGERSAGSQGLAGSAGMKDLELFEGMTEHDKRPLPPKRSNLLKKGTILRRVVLAPIPNESITELDS